MRHGSLFSGIGGFDLAADWMGWENVFHCEWNPFGQKVLKHYWPEAISYDDITKTDFSIHRGTIDILTGGFPCQPYSTAGKRLGKEDDRHLWPEMLRAIREIAPTWVVGENVRGLLSWNGGLVFDEVQADLEACGYEVLPFLLPACGVNAPHRRDRVWFVAYSNLHGHESRQFGKDRSKEGESEIEEQERQRIWNDYRGISEQETFTNSKSEGGEGLRERKESQHPIDGINGCDGFITNSDSGRQPIEEHWKEEPGQFTEKIIPNDWQNFPTKSPICFGNDGIPARLDGITFSKWRNESIKAGGNAIVPQVALQIFKAIEQMENS